MTAHSENYCTAAEPSRSACDPAAVTAEPRWRGRTYRRRGISAKLCCGLARLGHMSKETHVVEQRTKDLGPAVIVIDDDEGIRESLGGLLRSAGFRAILGGSVRGFSTWAGQKTCLLLDVRLPGQSGFELQRELAATQRPLSITFTTRDDEMLLILH